MKIKPRHMLTVIGAIILIFSSSTILYSQIINVAQSNLNITINELKTYQFDTIWSSLEGFHDQAKLEADMIASNIEEDIYKLSEAELQQLNYDMDNNIFNEDYHNILISNIEDYSFNGIDNHQNGIVIMNTRGYVEDFNYRRASQCTNNETQSYRGWDCMLENSFNKELEADAIDKLLNRTTGIIATESYNISHVKNHMMINELTHDSLLEVFLEEGVEGLRNYQILVPHYITNVGDIFGTPDINHGVKLENHKIIVVLEFNLYDQIANKYQDNNVNVNNVTYRYENLLRLFYVFGFISVIAVFILVIYLCSVYNHLLLQENDESHEHTEESENIES